MPDLSAGCAIDDYKAWISNLNDDKPRFLHVMLLISNPAASLRFYREGLGMKLLGSFSVEERRVTAWFMGFEVGAPAIELGHYWDSTDAIVSDAGFRYVAIGVPDIDAVISSIETIGAPVSISPTVLVEGMPRAAFVKDPDGYSIELFEMRKSRLPA